MLKVNAYLPNPLMLRANTELNETMKSPKRLVVYSFAVAAALSHVGAGNVAAEPAATCSCSAGAISNSSAKGSLVEVSGDVFVSGPTGYTEAKAGQSLALDSSVIVGPNGSANLTFGQCRVAAPADSTATISAKGSNVCVDVAKTFTGTVEQSAGFPALNSPAMMPLFIGVGSMGLGFVGLGVAVVSDKKASD